MLTFDEFLMENFLSFTVHFCATIWVEESFRYHDDVCMGIKKYYIKLFVQVWSNAFKKFLKKFKGDKTNIKQKSWIYSKKNYNEYYNFKTKFSSTFTQISAIKIQDIFLVSDRATLNYFQRFKSSLVILVLISLAKLHKFSWCWLGKFQQVLKINISRKN
jgi:hypothetical protein